MDKNWNKSGKMFYATKNSEQLNLWKPLIWKIIRLSLNSWREAGGERSLKRSQAGATELSGTMSDTMTALSDLPANGRAEFLALCRKGHDWRRVAVRFDNSHHSSVPLLGKRCPAWVSRNYRQRKRSQSTDLVCCYAMGKKWSTTGQETGVQLSNPTQNTRLVCIVCIVLQWCMYLLYVYIEMHSVINGYKLCMNRISSWSVNMKLCWIALN